jgi:hypothetical protein
VEAHSAVINIEDDQCCEDVLGELRKHPRVFAVQGAAPYLWPKVSWFEGDRRLVSDPPRPAGARLCGVD